ncbi:hypothetical protein H2200_001518 [Cladophialophora chaetospira]|uniref:Uncharacterized protein n=1 Tax=Cladophialophora chaetospira TaxID=386627 RepID=A0AA39CN42_9EURO|nr:hypothetical protein H2200_001518 [Cladophialophora chaetospira]
MNRAYKPLGLREFAPKPKAAKAASTKKVKFTAKIAPKKSSELKRKRSDDESSDEEKEPKPTPTAVPKSKKPKEDKTFHAGLDIGTTGSGESFRPVFMACTYNPAFAYGFGNVLLENIQVLQSWPGGQSRQEIKVPTRIAYAAENSFNPDDERDRWGYHVESGMRACNWPKLLLDEAAKKEDYGDELLQQAIGQGLMHLPTGKTAQDVISDFASHMHQHVFWYLGKKILSSALEQTPKRIVVPVPTLWTAAARDATRQAVKKAGFCGGEDDEIIIIDESEASALYIIECLRSASDGDVLKENNHIMIIDMGGGTIDASLYKVVRCHPLQLVEACPGEGAKIGGTTIDRALHALMQELFGEGFTGVPIEQRTSGSLFMNQFENDKRNYEGPLKSKPTMNLPIAMQVVKQDGEAGPPRYDHKLREAKITNAELKAMFEQVLQATFDIIRKLVGRIQEADQPTTSLRTIALCGGLSDNAYVFDSIREFANGLFPGGQVQVETPENPSSAVAQGAVLASKKSEGFHQPQDRLEEPGEGARAKNQMKWIVAKNATLRPNTKEIVRCYYMVENPRNEIKSAVIDQILYKCTSDQAPDRVDDPGVEQLATLRVDITEIARERRIKAKKGKRKYPESIKIDVDIELTMSSSKGVLEAVAKIGRKQVGTTQVSYTPCEAWE